MRASCVFLLTALLVTGCGAPPADEPVASDEQDLVALDPILGHLADTTPGSDFHAEELQPAQFPFSWGGADFPRSKAIAAVLGTPATLPPGLGDRSLVYTLKPGAELEICAQSATAKAKLWLYVTKSRSSAYCNNFTCEDPDELDETPRAKNVGDEVCTRGRIPDDAWGPHYVIVNLGPGSAAATATVTTRSIKLKDSSVPDTGAFAKASCTGTKIGVGDVQGLGLSIGKTKSVGTYDVDARTRSCNRFRGCTPWTAVDTSTLTLHGSCSGCIPGEWTNPAKHGSVFVAWNDVSFGPYAQVMFYPDGTTATGAAVTTNHVACDLSLTWLSSCSAAGDWTNWMTIAGQKMIFATAKENAFTKSCVRAIARPDRPKLASEYDDTEAVFHAPIAL